MKTFEGDLEEMAAESEQDRKDHARLTADLEWLLQHEDAMRVPIATRHLIDLGVDPVVVAKTLLIGDRDGGAMYVLANRATALAEHERAAGMFMRAAIDGCPVDVSVVQLTAGAVWIATQFGISRSMLRDFVMHAMHRPKRPDFVGCGAVDLVDTCGVRDRSFLIECIDFAQLPSFAPLEYSRSKS